MQYKNILYKKTVNGSIQQWSIYTDNIPRFPVCVGIRDYE